MLLPSFHDDAGRRNNFLNVFKMNKNDLYEEIYYAEMTNNFCAQLTLKNAPSESAISHVE